MRAEWQALERVPGPTEFDLETFIKSLRAEVKPHAEDLFKALLSDDAHSAVQKEEFVAGLMEGKIKRSEFEATDMTRADAEGEVYRTGDQAFLTNMQEADLQNQRVTVLGERAADGSELEPGEMLVRDRDGDVMTIHYDHLSPKPETHLELLARITHGAVNKDEMGFEEFRNSLKKEHRHLAKELFGSIDQDNSGGISREEIKKALESGKLTKEHFEKQHWLKSSTNDDKMFNNILERTKKLKGEISKSQFLASLHDKHKHLAEELFKKIDINGNGSISEEELHKALKAGHISREHFHSPPDGNDDDNLFERIRGPEDEDEAPDGELALSQFKLMLKERHQDQAEELFNKIDIDRSGGISREELRRAIRKGLIKKEAIKDEFFKGLEGDEGHIGNEHRLWGAGFGWSNHTLHLGYADGGLSADELVVQPMDKIGYRGVKDCGDHYQKIIHRISTNLTQNGTNAEAMVNSAKKLHPILKNLQDDMLFFQKGKTIFKGNLVKKQDVYPKAWETELKAYKDGQVLNLDEKFHFAPPEEESKARMGALHLVGQLQEKGIKEVAAEEHQPIGDTQLELADSRAGKAAQSGSSPERRNENGADDGSGAGNENGDEENHNSQNIPVSDSDIPPAGVLKVDIRPLNDDVDQPYPSVADID